MTNQFFACNFLFSSTQTKNFMLTRISSWRRIESCLRLFRILKNLLAYELALTDARCRPICRGYNPSMIYMNHAKHSMFKVNLYQCCQARCSTLIQNFKFKEVPPEANTNSNVIKTILIVASLAYHHVKWKAEFLEATYI